MLVCVFVTPDDLLCSTVEVAARKAVMLSGLNKGFGARSSSQAVLLPMAWEPWGCSVAVPQHEEQAWRSVVRMNCSVRSGAMN